MSVSEREQAQQWQKKDQHDDDDDNDPVSLVELPGSRVGEFLSTRKWPGFSDGIVVLLLHREVLQVGSLERALLQERSSVCITGSSSTHQKA